MTASLVSEGLLQQTPWVAGAVLALTALGGTLGSEPTESTQRGTRWLTRLSLACSVLVVCVVVISRVVTPSDWDFKCFWSWGAAIRQGANPYDQAELLRVVEPLGLAEETTPEFHCLYPPPSLLLFAPLGWMPFRTAMVVWALVQASALVASLTLLTRDFFKPDQRALALATCAVVAAWRPTAATFAYSQTNFLTLLMLLCFWRDRESPRAGLWLALGALVKPWFAGLGLYLLLRGRWRAIANTFLAGATMAAIGWVLLGGELYEGYFTREDVSQNYPLAQPLNQSLSGTLLRAFDPAGEIRTLGQAPWLLVLLGSFLAAVAATMKFGLRGREEAALAMLPPALLLAYPASLAHYGVALAPSIAWLLGRGGCRNTAMGVAGIASIAMAFKATLLASVAVLAASVLAALRASSNGSISHLSDAGK